MSHFLRTFIITALLFVGTLNSVNAWAELTHNANHTVNEDSYKTQKVYFYFDSSFTYASHTQASHGSVTYSSGSKNIKYTPNANYCGSDYYTYRLNSPTNGGGGPNPMMMSMSSTSYTTVAITVNVTCINDRPTISNITNKSILEDKNTGNIAFSVTDVETNNGSLSITKNSSNKTLVPTSKITLGGSGTNRTVKVTPAANKYGTSTITLTVSDGNLTKTDTFVVTVNSVEDAPVITQGTSTAITTNEDTVKTFTLNATDAENNNITWSILTQGSKGSATASGTGTSKTITYTPSANLNGSDSFVVKVKDTNNKSDTITVNVTINAVNDAPVIAQGTSTSKSTNEDTAKSFVLNASDIENSTLTWSILTQGTKGTAVASGTGTSKTITYTPSTNSNGSDSFVVKVSDGNKTDNITVNVTIAAINDAPVITQGTSTSVTTSEDISKTFTLNASDAENSTITWTIVSQPSKGSVSGATGTGTSKSLIYTPIENLNGTDAFTVQISDGSINDSIIVNVNVTAINDLPVIQSSTQLINQYGLPLTIHDDFTASVLAEDPEPEGSITKVEFQLDGGSWFQKLTPSYEHNYGQLTAGSHTLNYRATDNSGAVVNDSFVFNIQNAAQKFLMTGGVVPDAEFDTFSAPTKSDEVGAIPAQASTSGGSASYNLPISLPPGRNQMQPSVSINYSSRSGNGPLGVGFNLSATSAITRCSATVAQDDGYLLGWNYSDTDKLCFNGQRLIVDSGYTYGQSGAVYRTEMDTFVRITQMGGNINSSNSWFAVEYKNNQQATFGKTEDGVNSQTYAQGSSSPSSWLISKSYDRATNNIYYHYAVYGAGEYLIDNIKYTGLGENEGDRKVSFSYISRSDKTSQYHAGGYTRQTVLLDKITTSVSGANKLVYDLDYQYSSTGRALLQQIKQCSLGTQTDCYKPTMFNWSGGAFGKTLDDLLLNNGSIAYAKDEPDDGVLEANKLEEVLPHGDFDGNGVRDWDGYYVNAEGEAVTRTEMPNSCYRSSWIKHTCVDADINRDGITDLWRLAGTERELKLTLSSIDTATGERVITFPTDISTGIFFQDDFVANGRKDYIMSFADYNGDGWADMLVKRSVDVHRVEIYYHSQNEIAPYSNNDRTTVYTIGFVGQGFSSVPSGPIVYSETETVQPVGDFDGNGLPDFVVSDNWWNNMDVAYPSPRPISILLTQRNGNGVAFTTTAMPNLVNEGYFYSELMDVNGDGIEDWLYWAGSARLKIRINQGDASFASEIDTGIQLPNTKYILSELIPGEPGESVVVPKYQGAMLQYDINMDGRQELLLPGTRLVSSCAIISGQQRCGGDIYGLHAPNTSNPQYKVITPAAQLDDSIYEYDALYFSDANDGTLVTSYAEDTGLYGSAYQTQAVDAYGKGLTDLVFIYNNRASSSSFLSDTGTVLDGVKKGLLINYNHGSHLGSNIGDYMPMDMLQDTTNGLGIQSIWNYLPLSSGQGNIAGRSDKMYTMHANDTTDGYLHFASSMYVVNRFSQDNGVGGSSIVDYNYQDAMYNVEGRGFQGFKEVISYDNTRNTLSATVFDQQFPKAGKPISSSVHYVVDVADDTQDLLLSSTNNTWLVNNNHGNANIQELVHVYQQLSEAKNYSINSDFDTSTRITTATTLISDIDEWGNITDKTTTVVDDYGTYTNQTVTTFDDNKPTWWLTKIIDQTVTKTVGTGNQNFYQWLPAASQYSSNVVTAFEWNSSYRSPSKLTLTASDSTGSENSSHIVATTYTTHGLPKVVTQHAQNATDNRVLTYAYTTDGYFVENTVNDYFRQSTHSWDKAFGKPTNISDANNIDLTTTFDGLGRPSSVTKEGSPTQYTRLYNVTGDDDAPAMAKFKQLTSGLGIPESVQYIDALGRVLRSGQKGFDDTYIYTDKTFDAQGNTEFEGLPRKLTDTLFGATYVFDGLGRATTKTKKQVVNNYGGDTDFVTLYTYNGLTTNINAAGLLMSRTYNSMKQLIQTVDADTGVTKYAYDELGNPIVIEDASQKPNKNQIVASYNAFGQKYLVNDPNQGITSFTYNRLGEVKTEIDANNDSINYVYDKLGRLDTRTVSYANSSLHAPAVNHSANFTYDKIGALGLPRTESGNGVVKTYDYDTLTNLIEEQVEIDNKTYITNMLYDANFGRLKGLRYPNDLTISYQYDSQGYLVSEQNAASGYAYRQVSAMDQWGNVTASTLGNNVQTSDSYANQTGQMLSTYASISGSSVHNIVYGEFDVFGNVKSQENFSFDEVETFEYDNLQRLTQSQVTHNGSALGAIDYGYDAVGNFTFKTDYAQSYNYTGAGPNAVSSIVDTNNVTQNFAYDSKGNMTSSTDGNLTSRYNVFNKPVYLKRHGTTSEFTYGADLSRYKQVRSTDGKTFTTYYVGKHFEEEYEGANKTIRAYISDVAIFADTVEQGLQLRYTHKDRLGSSTDFTDHLGNVISKRGYDPFGKPRVGATSGRLIDLAIASGLSVIDLNNRRGFTDHEHLDEQALIHMNGRVYDYNLGRFMSVDPFIQSPGNSQSINPYSYIMNNPLAGTDPSGYTAMTGSRIEGHDTGASGAGWGMKAGLNIDTPEVQKHKTISNGISNSGKIAANNNFKSKPMMDREGQSERDSTIGTNGTNEGRRAETGSTWTQEDRVAAKASDESYDVDDGGLLSDVGVTYEPKDGFSATLSKNDDKYFLAFRGTDEVKADGLASIRQGVGMESSQYEQAVALALEVSMATGGNVVFTGHSLGGGLAVAAANAAKGRAITFNAAGVGSRYNSGSHSGVRAHLIRGDALSATQNNRFTVLGLIMPNTVGQRVYHNSISAWDTPLGRHSMKQFKGL